MIRTRDALIASNSLSEIPAGLPGRTLAAGSADKADVVPQAPRSRIEAAGSKPVAVVSAADMNNEAAIWRRDRDVSDRLVEAMAQKPKPGIAENSTDLLRWFTIALAIAAPAWALVVLWLWGHS